MQKLNIVSKWAILILQLVNHCNITLSEDTLLLLHLLGEFSSNINAYVSPKNLACTCV